MDSQLHQLNFPKNPCEQGAHRYGLSLTCLVICSHILKEACRLPAHLCFVFLLYSALLSWCHLNRHDSALLSKINDLLDAVGKYEEHVLKCLNSVHPQPHLGELLDSVQDMDLSCTIPAEEEFNGTKSERPCGSGATFSESCCRSNGEADSVQSENCQTKKHGDSESPTLAWVKEQTVCLIQQLGLSWDILQLIQQLEN